MIKTYHSISIKYGSYTKRFQWKRAYTPAEFIQVLADLFQVKQKILGLQDQDGNLYDISFFCHNPNEILPEPYTLLVQGGTPGHRATASASSRTENRFYEDHLYANTRYGIYNLLEDPNSFYGSQDFGSRNLNKSENFKQCLTFPVGFVSDLQNFKTIFLSEESTSDIKASILFLFENNQEKRVIFEKFSAILEDYASLFDYFFSFASENDLMDDNNENLFVPAPCFIIYLGGRKLLEMSLDIGEQTLERIFLKMSRELPRDPQPGYTAKSMPSINPAVKEKFTNQFSVKSQEKPIGRSAQEIRQPVKFDDFEIENFERISKFDINQKQEKYIQLANDLEKRNILDSSKVAVLKTRIIDEDQNVYKEIDEFTKTADNSEKKDAEKRVEGPEKKQKGPEKKQESTEKKLESTGKKLESTEKKSESAAKKGGGNEKHNANNNSHGVPLKQEAKKAGTLPQQPIKAEKRSHAENLAWMQQILDKVVFQKITNQEERNTLNHFALSSNPIVAAIFQVFDVNNDAGELIESLQTLLSKKKKPIRQDSGKKIQLVETRMDTEDEEELEQQKSPFSRQLERLEQENPDLWNQIEDEEEAVKHKQEQEVPNNVKKEQAVNSSETKITTNLAVDSVSIIVSEPKQSDKPKNPPAKEEKCGNDKKNNNPVEKPHPITVDQIWDFCDKQKAKLQSAEYGMLLHLKNSKPNLFKDIAKTSKSLGEAFDQMKTLAKTKFSKFLIDNFESEEIDALEKNKHDSDSLIFSTLSIFKSNGNLDIFKNSIKSQLEVSNNNSEVGNERMILSDVPSTQNKGNTLELPGTKSPAGRFSFIAEQRKAHRKTSFRMNLLTTGIQDLIDKEKKKEEESNLLVTLHQEEDAEYTALMINYFQNDQDKLLLRELFEDFLKKAKYLTPNDKKMLHIFFGSCNVPLLLALQKYEKLRSTEKIKKDIQKILEREDQFWHEQESPLIKSKIKKLNQFKHLLVRLKDDLILTQKQFKLLNYLYLVEDMAVLSAFEVYINSDDMDDFIENLKIVARMHFFKSKLDIDEIEQFDDNVEFQLGMLYGFKKYLSAEQRKNLEKVVRAGDVDLIKIYNNYKVVKKKSIFIDSLKTMAKDKSQAVKQMEEIIKEQKKEPNNVEKQKEILETFIFGKFLKQVHDPNLVFRLIEEENNIVNSIYEVYDTIKDKEDFIENITVLYKWAYKDNFLRIIKEFKEEEGWPKRYLDFFNYVVKVDLESIMGMYEVYMMDKDRKELKESLKVALKIFKDDIKNLERFTGPL